MRWQRQSNYILTINSGSSSIKFSIYDFQTAETLVIVGEF